MNNNPSFLNLPPICPPIHNGTHTRIDTDIHFPTPLTLLQPTHLVHQTQPEFEPIQIIPTTRFIQPNMQYISSSIPSAMPPLSHISSQQDPAVDKQDEIHLDIGSQYKPTPSAPDSCLTATMIPGCFSSHPQLTQVSQLSSVQTLNTQHAAQIALQTGLERANFDDVGHKKIRDSNPAHALEPACNPLSEI